MDRSYGQQFWNKHKQIIIIISFLYYFTFNAYYLIILFVNWMDVDWKVNLSFLKQL